MTPEEATIVVRNGQARVIVEPEKPIKKRQYNCTNICVTGSRQCQCAKEDLEFDYAMDQYQSALLTAFENGIGFEDENKIINLLPLDAWGIPLEKRNSPATHDYGKPPKENVPYHVTLPPNEKVKQRKLLSGQWVDTVLKFDSSEYRTIIRFTVEEEKPGVSAKQQLKNLLKGFTEDMSLEEARKYLIAEGLSPDEIAKDEVHFVHGLIKEARMKTKPQKEYCDRCDGVGWYEGGPKLQTTCEDCNGTGIKKIAEGSKPAEEEWKLTGVDNRARFNEASKFRMQQWTQKEMFEAIEYLTSLSYGKKNPHPAPVSAEEQGELWVEIARRFTATFCTDYKRVVSDCEARVIKLTDELQKEYQLKRKA